MNNDHGETNPNPDEQLEELEALLKELSTGYILSMM